MHESAEVEGKMNHDVIIVGAGIIGASIAWHLARAGQKALVIDAHLPGTGASGRSFGWVNASFYADAHHHRLRAASMTHWQDMLRAYQGTGAVFRGAVLWDVPDDQQAQMARDLRANAYPVEQIDTARFRAMVPKVAQTPDAALFLPSEGAIEAQQIARHWLAASGATVLTGLSVTGLAEKDGVIVGVETETGPLLAKQVVVAAGVATQHILATVGVNLPMLRRPGMLLTTKPVPHCLEYVLVTPFGEVRQDATGRIIASTVAGHQGDDTEHVHGSPVTHGDATVEKLRALLPELEIELESVSLALRPVPKDGLPAIGPIGPDGLHVATMHSGVTLAPIVGSLVAQELQGQPQDAGLAPYRPDRFSA